MADASKGRPAATFGSTLLSRRQRRRRERSDESDGAIDAVRRRHEAGPWKAAKQDENESSNVRGERKKHVLDAQRPPDVASPLPQDCHPKPSHWLGGRCNLACTLQPRIGRCDRRRRRSVREPIRNIDPSAFW
ncbi:hypothetical protein RJ55_03890 [Drechmeria coniospora]|nr:hypothetical protein RJ55_03890 [Drechmeria coniospora]